MNGQTDRIKTASGINVIAGIWLMISPFILGISGTIGSTNIFTIGLIVTILALIRLYTATEGTTWLSWVNAILGLWLLLSPLFFAGMLMSSIWNSVLLGIIIIIAGVWSAMSSTMSRGHPRAG